MSKERFAITRKIEIDAGHRLPFHDSKCRNLHGHRYVIEATCSGDVIEQGAQKGMVMDFSFLKEEMEAVIDVSCDHGFMIWSGDGEVLAMFFPNEDTSKYVEQANSQGYWAGDAANGMKLYIMPTVPTAENLAKHWYDLLVGRIADASNGNATLDLIKVWETPNCTAQYPA